MLSLRPHQKKKNLLRGKGPTSHDYRAKFLLNYIYFFKDYAFFLISDVKDTINFLKLVFIMLLVYFFFSFLLRLLKYETHRTLNCFKKCCKYVK